MENNVYELSEKRRKDLSQQLDKKKDRNHKWFIWKMIN